MQDKEIVDMNRSERSCPACVNPLNTIGIDGHVGGYVVGAISRVGYNDLERFTYEFIKRVTRNVEISAKDYDDDPKRYVSGYLSWLRKEGHIHCPPSN
jgi:hypothetical protein